MILLLVSNRKMAIVAEALASPSTVAAIVKASAMFVEISLAPGV